MSIVAILTFLAVPNFTESSKRSRMVSNTNELLSLVQLGRAEALRRGGRVILATIDDSDNWASGLRLYADVEVDNQYTDTSEDLEIRRAEPFGNGAMAMALNGSKGILFDSRGFVSLISPSETPSASGALETFKICDDRDDESGRNINVLISGSAYISEAVDC